MKHTMQCPDDNAEQISTAQKKYNSVMCRAKVIWMQQRNAELVQMSRKDPKAFWKVYSSRKRDVCPICPEDQTEAFKGATETFLVLK